MTLVDANLLIYAVNQDAPDHERARAWLQAKLSSDEPFGLASTVSLAFLRITTRPGIFQQPLRVDEALGFVDSWVAQPCVHWVAPGPNHWSIFRNLVSAVGTAGNLTSDAHLAAMAIEHGYPIASADHDFGRFPGIRLVNPLR